MSETVKTQPNVKSTQKVSVDARVLAQVERWIAMIREFNREQIKT